MVRYMFRPKPGRLFEAIKCVEENKDAILAWRSESGVPFINWVDKDAWGNMVLRIGTKLAGYSVSAGEGAYLVKIGYNHVAVLQKQVMEEMFDAVPEDAEKPSLAGVAHG